VDLEPNVYMELLSVSGKHDRIKAYIARTSRSAAEKDRLNSIGHLIHREKTHICGEVVGSNVINCVPVWRVSSRSAASGS
jgi:hypothetical protein